MDFVGLGCDRICEVSYKLIGHLIYTLFMLNNGPQRFLIRQSCFAWPDPVDPPPPPPVSAFPSTPAVGEGT